MNTTTEIASRKVIARAQELASKVRTANRPTVFYTPASDGTEHRVLVDYESSFDTGPVIGVYCSCTWGQHRRHDGPLCTHAIAVLMTIQTARRNAS